MTPDVGRLLAAHAGEIHRDLMEQYVDYHRPTWWIAWMVEHMVRNESPFVFPTAAMEIVSARALILGEPGEDLEKYIDIPWCKADEFYVRKLVLTIRNAGERWGGGLPCRQ
jgi:hypothetical protein